MKVEVNGQPRPRRADPRRGRSVAGDPPSQPQLNGVVSNLRITGSPTDPGRPRSLGGRQPRLVAADYGDTIDAKDSVWRKDQAEIVGSVLENAPGSKRESLLVYRRPLVEDGTLEYDFFYEPGKTVVFRPSAAWRSFSGTASRTHVLTDGPYEAERNRSGNEAPLAQGGEKPPLEACRTGTTSRSR